MNQATLFIRLFLFSFLFFNATQPIAARADAPLEGTKPAQWRLIWTSDPATSATLSWSTAKQGSKHSVKFQIKGSDDTQSIRIAESGRYAGGELELYYHHARLTDLKPSTAYEVQMQSDDDLSPVFYFVTAPAEDRSFSMLHGGDSRTDQKARRRVNQVMATMVEDSFENDDPSDDILALAHGGDFIVSGPNMEQWSRWLSDTNSRPEKMVACCPSSPHAGTTIAESRSTRSSDSQLTTLIFMQSISAHKSDSSLSIPKPARLAIRQCGLRKN